MLTKKYYLLLEFFFLQDLLLEVGKHFILIYTGWSTLILILVFKETITPCCFTNHNLIQIECFQVYEGQIIGKLNRVPWTLPTRN